MDRWNRGLVIVAAVLWLALVGCAGTYLFYYPPW
jgi:hypothetical protein